VAVNYSKQGKRSRGKGKRGERLACAAIKEQFPTLNPRRSVQFKGTTDSCDVEIPEASDWFVEVKFVERLNVWEAIERAVVEAGDKLPILMHKKTRSDWLVTVRLSDLKRLATNVVEKSSSSTPMAAG
jgi:hypothetical protein